MQESCFRVVTFVHLVVLCHLLVEVEPMEGLAFVKFRESVDSGSLRPGLSKWFPVWQIYPRQSTVEREWVEYL